MQRRNQSIKKRRIFGYDLMKCIAMYFVVVIHYAYSSGLYPDTALSNGISVLSAIGVPLFFAVNGALLFAKKLDFKKHIKKIVSIVLVVVAWKIITIFAIGGIYGVSPFVDGVRAFVAYLLPGTIQIGGRLNQGHFWFMDALIALYIIFPLLKTAFDSDEGKKTLKGVFIAVLVLASIVPYAGQIQDMLSNLVAWKGIDISGFGQWNIFGGYSYALLFFIGGGLAPEYIEKLKNSIPKNGILCWGLFLVGWLATFGLGRYQSASAGISFGVEGAYSSPVTVVMVFSLFVLCVGFDPKEGLLRSLIESIGRNTLGIYFLHMIPIVALFVFLSPLVGTLPLWANCLIITAVYLCCYVLALVFSRVPVIRLLFRV